MISANTNKVEHFLVTFEGIPKIFHVCQQKDHNSPQITAQLMLVTAALDVELHCSGPEGISCFQAILTTSELDGLYQKLKWIKKGLAHEMRIVVDSQQCTFKRDKFKRKFQLVRKEKSQNWKILKLGNETITRMLKRVALL